MKWRSKCLSRPLFGKLANLHNPRRNFCVVGDISDKERGRKALGLINWVTSVESPVQTVERQVTLEEVLPRKYLKLPRLHKLIKHSYGRGRNRLFDSRNIYVAESSPLSVRHVACGASATRNGSFKIHFHHNSRLWCFNFSKALVDDRKLRRSFNSKIAVLEEVFESFIVCRCMLTFGIKLLCWGVLLVLEHSAAECSRFTISEINFLSIVLQFKFRKFHPKRILMTWQPKSNFHPTTSLHLTSLSHSLWGHSRRSFANGTWCMRWHFPFVRYRWRGEFSHIKSNLHEVFSLSCCTFRSIAFAFRILDPHWRNTCNACQVDLWLR